MIAGKPHLPLDLVCVDTTNKVQLSERAIQKCLDQATFNSVKLLTHDGSRKHAVMIPKVSGLDAYSNFMVRELHKYVESNHALIIQYDGYILNMQAWTNDFLQYDYAGAPWLQWRAIGNGGFSLRSKRLLQAGAQLHPEENAHPEDVWLCHRRRSELQGMGMRWMPFDLACRFAFEGRSFTGKEWTGLPTHWAGQFGFHSWLTPLPEYMDKPLIFHHSGDMGDVIYSLAAAKAMGGGLYFFSADNRYPYPKPARSTPTADWTNQIAPLLNEQDYIWGSLWTHGTPYSTDVDFNAFREFYRDNRAENWMSLFHLHQKRFDTWWPEDEPWLTVPDPITIPGRPIVVNHTDRYLNPKFPWYQLVQEYGDRMVFIGTQAEADNFQGMAPPRHQSIPWHRTNNLLELAQVIAGAKVFIANQSCPLAIAHGLGQRVIVEEWPMNANCHLKRPGAIYFKDGGPLDIPPDWLK